MPRRNGKRNNDPDRDEKEIDEKSERRSASLDERRSHHNALEKRRRDDIKIKFNKLRDVIPSLKGKKVSRIQIVEGAADHLIDLRHEIEQNDTIARNIQMQNAALERNIAEMSALFGYTNEELDAKYAALFATPVPMETGQSLTDGAPGPAKRRK